MTIPGKRLQSSDRVDPMFAGPIRSPGLRLPYPIPGPRSSISRRGAWLCAALAATIWPAVAAAAAATRPAIDPDNPPRGLFADHWYALTFQGKKCGHMHSTVTRKTDRKSGLDVIETRTEMAMQVGRAGQTIRIGTVEQSTETIDGSIVRFSSETDMSLLSMKLVGEVRGDEVVVTTKQLGQAVTRTYPLPKGALMTWGSYRDQVKRGLATGMKYTVLSYAPAIAPDRALETAFEIGKREPVDLYGRVVNAWRTRQTMKAPGLLGPTGIESIAWIDDRFTLLKMEMEVAQMRVTAVRCDRAIALKEGDPPELMAETLIPARLPAGADNARSITYRISRKGPTTTRSAARLADLPQTAMQRCERRGDDLVVTVTRSGLARANPAAPRPSKRQLEEMLAATTYTNTDDPEIRRLAKQAAGDEKNPLRLARRLRAFVSDYVQSKDLGVGFATASEVARSRQGDCSEHAVLLAALARACGLPSRGVSGIVHARRFAEKNDVFVWHMWTQVWIDDRWVDLDAALEQDDLDATHIAMGLVTFGDAGLAEMALPIWNLIGRLKIDVLSVEPNP